MDPRNELLNLFRLHAFKFYPEEIVLSSGKKSKYYFNCKEITLHPERMKLLSQFLVSDFVPKNFSKYNFDSVGGLTMGADPIIYSIVFEYLTQSILKFPLIVRKNKKTHGLSKKIEMVKGYQKTCLVVDDVVTTGGSTILAIETLRSQGIRVDYGFCLIDREEGGVLNIEKLGVKMIPVFQLRDFLV